MTWEESNERIGLELIPYKQPAHSGESLGGGRWSLFPGGFRGEVPTMCVHVCTHVSCLCILYTCTYILELIINLMLFLRNPLPYQILGVKLWFPWSLELLPQGLCTGPLLPKVPFLEGLALLPAGLSLVVTSHPPQRGSTIPCRLPVSAVVENVEALTTLSACCYCVGCSLYASPEAWESLGLETSPFYLILHSHHLGRSMLWIVLVCFPLLMLLLHHVSCRPIMVPNTIFLAENRIWQFMLDEKNETKPAQLAPFHQSLKLRWRSRAC